MTFTASLMTPEVPIGSPGASNDTNNVFTRCLQPISRPSSATAQAGPRRRVGAVGGDGGDNAASQYVGRARETSYGGGGAMDTCFQQ